MLKEERQQIILDEIERSGSVVVAHLADEFNVSRMTIRRDLKEIEAAEVIKRTYGGAILTIKNNGHSEPPTLDRMDMMREEKQRLARATAALIGENEMIFLGSGTTTLYVARELLDRDDITVVSNALTILNELAANGKMTLIGVGGFLRRREFSMIGHFADKVISDLRVDKVIMGIRGAHPRFGLTSEHPQELLTDRTIMGISDTIIIVADHSKIGHVSTSRTAPVAKASKLITGAEAPKEMVEAIQALGVEVILI